MTTSEAVSQSEPGLVPGGAAPGEGSYRVLARKYRPATFADLIGQDAMVRTISNAFETARIPQAWILTGVRGVGKTTTARILARALNYELPDGSVTAPTVGMTEIGIHCRAIMESRHIDVIEMDAASHNGVDDVRQINDAIRYAPVSARHKVYILDEVHMLSTAAFNALLKTLEEPPPHAKFIFATTEIRKVPVTILSRCQRFDLRRVDAGVLVKHLATVAARERVEVEPEALALIARAAEGSVRDCLSLLDQGIAHAAGPVRTQHVREMLGLADRARVIDLFEATMRGDMAAAVAELRAQYDTGADPVVILADLAEITHFVTRVKIVPSVAEDPALIEVERARGRALAEKLSMRVLARAWQMLLKGIAEVTSAARPLAAAEMVLVRIAYAADLPTPDEVIRALDGKDAEARRTGGAENVTRPTAPAQGSAPQLPRRPLAMPPAGSSPLPACEAAAHAAAERMPKAPAITNFEDLVALATARRDVGMKLALERDVRLVRCEDGRLEIRLETTAARTLVNDLARKLSQWTGRPWVVVVSSEEALPTLKAQEDARKGALKTGVRGDPLVQAVLARFPGAEIVEVRKGETAVREPPVPVDEMPEPFLQESDVDARSAHVALPGQDDD
jgi:DNA polymerase-3 subunit gamma/tau